MHLPDWHTTSIPMTSGRTTIPRSTIDYTPLTLNIPVLQEVMRDGARWYALDGECYPSVTTMLKATDTEGNAALQKWRTAVGYDTAQEITRTAAARGTRWHTFCEQFVLRQPIAWSLLTEPTDAAYATFIAETLNDRIQTVLASETRVVSTSYGLAGRLDMAVQLQDGRLAILDFKTGKKLKSGNRLTNYAVQCAFYADALTEYLTSSRIDTIVIAQLLPDRIVWQETEVAGYRPLLRERIADFAAMVNTQLL